MNTIEPMVAPGPLSWEGPPPQPSRRWLWMVLASVVALGTATAAVSVPLPYYAIAPGSARQVNDLISAPEGQAHPPKGRVFFATVSLKPVNPIDIAHSWVDDDVEIVKEEEVRGSTPRERFRQVNLDAMDESKRTAVVVALRRLGYEVPARGNGALITDVLAGRRYPAEGRLNVGDVITAVDGRPVRFMEDAIEVLRSHRPREVVRLDVRAPDGQTRVEQLPLAPRDDDPNAGMLGVTLQTDDLSYDMPFDVDIDSGDIGGPSAGLAFTLALLDTLTPGELTGGVRVAATGTMALDGHVGPVGGVPQKTAAVIDSGARYFLVPPPEYEDARRRAGGRVTVLRVGTLDEALAALESIGGEVAPVRARPGAPSQR